MTESAEPVVAASGAQVPDFYVGDWKVQPGLNRTSRDGTVVHLRPQLMDVLVCLARRPGVTVSRPELLAEVWTNQFVAETALARCMAELRQALGDSAQAPAIIETIPKRGYRLIAPVSAANNGRSAGASQSPASAAPGGPAAPAESDLAVGRLRPRGAQAAAVILLVLALAAAVWLAVSRRATPPPAATARESILLVFVNATGDPAFDDTLRLALAVYLERSPLLRLVPERRVHEALVAMGLPADTPITPTLALQICGRLGATAALSGTITALGARYVIGLEATACASREIVARVQAEAGRKEDVLDVLSGVADTLRQRLHESL